MASAKRRRIAGLIAILLGAAVLAGCGQKGALYYPEDDPKKRPRKSGLDPSIRPG